MKKLKILVVDDNQKHLDSALATLKDHNVTICNNYDEAVNLLEGQYVDPKGKSCYSFEEGAKALPYWDAVLCDLLMPAGENEQGPRGMRYVGQEMPVGWALALSAAFKGAKYVAVVTDMNHHNHPASALLDGLKGKVIKVEGAKVLMTNNPRFIGVGGAKDWGMVLQKIIDK
ncbi:MAG: response regulator [Candidatus Moranbacteria bacterium]|nr:response regulator [Candidatus Moranbacteria bacterium]